MKTLLSFLLTLSFATGLFAADKNDAFHEVFGPRHQPGYAIQRNRGPKKGLDTIHRWNQIAIDATGLDHTPVAPGENRVFGEQLGPTRASRAMAIVHIAIFDSVNAVAGVYEGFTRVKADKGALSLDVAIAQAAHDSLVALFPSQTPTFDAYLAEDLASVKSAPEKARGIALGQRAAAAVLALRVNDGSATPEPQLGVGWATSDLPGHWRQDPISQGKLALGAHWGDCLPFVLDSSDQFRTPPPPPLNSPAYAAAYNEARRLGGDGVITPTQRTPAQTFIGTFWAYDGTPSLCAPPRLYNQLTVQIADQTRLGPLELSHLLALVNVSLADTAMAVWESKYHWDFWRPVTAIRESDAGTGPTGTGDGNSATIGDPTFTPLGAPASNLSGPNFTPPFPAYPSGHAGFGAALFETLRRFYGNDRIAFTFVSDEFNGATKANTGEVRPYLPRSFATLSQAEEENGQSRIYLGIHWAFDKTEAITQGRKVADYIYDHTFLPVRP